MDTLLIHSDKRMGNFLSFLLERNFSARVIHTTYLQGALDMLITGKDFGLVIYSSTDEKHDLFKKFISSKHGIPAVLITSKPSGDIDKSLDPDILVAVPSQDCASGIFEAIEAAIKKGTLNIQAPPSIPGEFCRIPVELLVDASPLDAPVFIRLNEKKHVRLFHGGDVFSQEDLEKYSVTKKIEHFYINKADSDKFIQHISQNLKEKVEKIDEGEEISLNTSMDLTISATEVIQDLSRKLGYTPEIKELVNQSVDLVVKSMKEMPNIQKLLERLEKEKNRYIAAHSAVTAFISCAIAKSMKMESQGVLQKLTMASYLHDITLTDQDLAMLRNTDDLEMARDMYKPEDIAAIEDHPRLAAEIARSMSDRISDVDSIILQHHEFGDGKGFPNKLNPMQVSPLSCIFIIAHEFVLCSIEGTMENPEMIKELKDKFSHGNFRNVFKQIDVKALLANKS